MRIVYALVVSLLSFILQAQNLVPNPSFEEYIDCPYSTGEFGIQVVGWQNWSYSPDYFHVCGNEVIGIATVPANAWGYQFPVTGDAYSGLYTYQRIFSSPSFSDAREYIATELIEPLEIGESYYLMVYVSKFDGGPEIEETDWNCITSNFGFKFYTEVPDYNEINPMLPPDNAPHFNYAEMISEEDGWLKIEGWITADAPYEWVALGNFMDDAHTVVLPLADPDLCMGILYIDNVCISLYPDSCDYLLSHRETLLDKQLDVYPNPCIDHLEIKGSGLVQIFDLRGALHGIYRLEGQRELVDVSALPAGVYVLRFTDRNNTILHRKIIKQ